MDHNILHTHKDLIVKCREGHRVSQYKLYELYIDGMYNVSMRMLGSKEDAEDIVQNSFVEAFRNLSNFRFESTFGSWLKRIVINKCINHLKLKKIDVVPFDSQEYHISEESYEESEKFDISKIREGIKLLPKGYKQIINLYLIEGYDHVEIGEILGVTTSTSKSQYHRAKKKLVNIINAL